VDDDDDDDDHHHHHNRNSKLKVSKVIPVTGHGGL
jgi:hypothetical protein